MKLDKTTTRKRDWIGKMYTKYRVLGGTQGFRTMGGEKSRG